MKRTIEDCLRPTRPKKILSCDGGGIRGLISVQILAKLESDLRAERQDPDLVLGDYFDFVCGTSTGAMIAACIATGMSTAAIRRFYVDGGKEMFDKASLLKRLRYSYNDEPLARTLQAAFNAQLGYVAGAPWVRLGDPGLHCLLMMVMRNHSTDSPWPVTNNPKAKYNQRTHDDGSPRQDCNLDLPLWQLVRASTAAPTYFPPETITLAEGTPREYQYVFVDGGVTTYNNAAFLAFQMAVAAPYGMHWSTGTDDMLIISVGTGSAALARLKEKAGDLWLLDHATLVPGALMNAAAAGWDMSCRILGDCRFGAPIDREFGDMVVGGANIPNFQPNSTAPKLFSYVRYDLDLSPSGLRALDIHDIQVEQIEKLDSIEHLGGLQRVGSVYADTHVKLEHLEGFY